ncbi:MAG: glycoside hydrolase, family 19 [Herbaspirillum sp.]|nr:glycoside hydrolase, family 19 [Herbaspirillum sp.]
MNITLEQIVKIMPHAQKVAPLFVGPLNAALEEFGINTEKRIEFFFAEIAHESGSLQAMQENLNYRADGLMKTWPKRFPTLAIANTYAHQPAKIANKVYANRGGNGDEASGDGWRYRGAGLIGLTFHDNQKKCGDYFGIAVEDVGDWLRTPEGACRSAAWFWSTHGCNELADADDFDGVSDAINIGHLTDTDGDAIGYEDRLAFLEVAEGVI